MIVRTLTALLLALAPCAAPASVYAHPASAEALAELLGPITGTLRHAKVLRGGYMQRKTLHDLPEPLIAQGTFVFVRDRGMAWRTVEPFASELVITRDAIVQRDGPDSEGVRMTATEHRGIRAVAELLFAVFALDFETLALRFELFGTRAGDGWELGLRPRSGGLSGSLDEIVVSGREVVERIVLRDTRGDVTEIRVHGTRTSMELPPEDELKRLLR